jgi:ABC-2 type transport system permease protein
MNVFLKELKSYRWSLLFWSLGMIFLIASGMAKYATYSQSNISISDIVGSMPQSVQTIFGMTGLDLSTATGYFGVLFAYIVLIATIHAVLLGSGIISKEERDRTSEFLFVKPISRARVISAKLSAGLVNVFAFSIITVVSSLYFVSSIGKVSIPSDIMLLMSGMVILQLMFFFIGTAVAAFVKKPRAAMSIAGIILLVAYVITYLVNLSNNFDFLKYFSPFKYFDAVTIMPAGKLDPGYVVISFIIVAICIAVTYKSYSDRDLEV